ncbi:hypothetical protein ACPA9J_08520 [Pseudomonas aeruginosa]
MTTAALGGAYTLLDYYLGATSRNARSWKAAAASEADRSCSAAVSALLDMARYAAALGYKSGGFAPSSSDLDALRHPALVPSTMPASSIFVVVRDVCNDPSLMPIRPAGNINSFTQGALRGNQEDQTSCS